MRLIVFRHGPAVDREDPSCPPDAERALTVKGKRKTKKAARGLSVLGVEPQYIFSSPYVRAAETADILAKVLTKRSVPVLDIDELQPNRHPRDFLRVIRDVNEGDTICVGHAPHLDILIANCVGSMSTITNLKKAGAACIEFAPDRPRGDLLWLATPRALRRLGRDE